MRSGTRAESEKLLGRELNSRPLEVHGPFHYPILLYNTIQVLNLYNRQYNQTNKALNLYN
jgi:hypothetical protein